MSRVPLAHFWSHGLPKFLNAHVQLLSVLGLHSGPEIVLYCPPDIFDRAQVWAGGWRFPPVDVVFLKVVLGPSAGVLGIVVLLETMMCRVMFFNEW